MLAGKLDEALLRFLDPPAETRPFFRYLPEPARCT
jgi:hypothetical protein